jgi:hypothetical protein
LYPPKAETGEQKLKKTTQAATPIAPEDPAMQTYLAAITAAGKVYAATLPPCPSSTLPVLVDALEQFAIATERFLSISEESTMRHKALRCVNEAEAALYARVDELRDAAREFGRECGRSESNRPPA